MAIEFSAEQAQERLPDLLDRVESGEEIVITRFGAPSVRLQPAGDVRAGAGIASGVITGAWLGAGAEETGGDSGFDVGTDYLTGLSG
ncbi:type II toxin-antitoxin system Phd/YefM family antitoxin [Parasphingorhabdus pacifica]